MDLAKYKSRLWSLFRHLRVGSVPQNLDHICQSLSATKLRIHTLHKILRHWTEELQNISTDLSSRPAMIIWNTPTAAPRLPSQYSGLGSSRSSISKAWSRYHVILLSPARGRGYCFLVCGHCTRTLPLAILQAKIKVRHWAHCSGWWP